MAKKVKNHAVPTDEAADQPESAAAIVEESWTSVDPKTLEVNPAFQQLIPLPSKGELQALEESIRREGCLEPLLVWKGHNVILDGHTRRELCLKHDKPVKVREVDLPDEKAAIAFVLEIQRQRRNLTREALSYFRGQEYNASKQQHGGAREPRKAKGQNVPLPTTAERLAEKYGVVAKTIIRDGQFAEAIDKIVENCQGAVPDLRRKVLSADVKLTHGLARKLGKLPPAEQKKLVRVLVKEGELLRPEKGEHTKARTPKQVARSLVERLKQRGDEHARAVLKQMARQLGLTVSETASEK